MILFYLLVGVMPLVRHSLWSETIVAGLTLNKLLGLLCLVVAAVHFAARGARVAFLETTQARLFLLFASLVIVSFLFRGPSVPLEESALANFVSFVLLFFMTRTLVDSTERLRWVMLWLIGGVAFASLHTIREWQLGGYADARPGWVAGDPNYFAFSAILALPIAFFLASGPGPAWQRRYAAGCLAVTLFAFSLAGSRGGFVALLATFLFVALCARRRLRFLVVGGAALALVLIVAPLSPVERFLEPTSGDIQSNEVRRALLIAGLRMFKDNFWLGVGAANYKPMVGLYGAPDVELRHLAHNTYLEVAAEHGVSGVLLFVALLVTTVRSLRQVRGRLAESDDPFVDTAARGLEAGLLAGAAAMVFLSTLHVRLLWFMIMLSACLATVVRDRRLERKARVSARVPRALPGVQGSV